MYVRIARFEGGDMDEIEAEGALMKEGIEALKRGEKTRELPPRLAEVTSRCACTATAATRCSKPTVSCRR